MAEWFALHLFTVVFGISAIGGLGLTFALKGGWARPAGIGTFISSLSYMLRLETAMIELSVVLLVLGLVLMVYGLVDSFTSGLWPSTPTKPTRRPPTR